MASLVPRSPRRWTKQEDQILQREAELQLSQGSVKDWNRIAAQLPGRTNKDCRKRWSKTYGCVRKGAWDQAEDERLTGAIRKYGLRWVQVASEVETRNADQCSKRWQHSLDAALDHSKWSLQDDDRLLMAVEIYGRNWKTISTNVFPSRSGTDIKNRHVCLVRKQKKTSGQSIEAQAGTRSRPAKDLIQRTASNQTQSEAAQDDEDSEFERIEEEDEEDEAEQTQQEAFHHSRVNSAAEGTNFEFENFFGNSAMVSRGSISGDFMFSGHMSDLAFTPSLTSSSDPR